MNKVRLLCCVVAALMPFPSISHATSFDCRAAKNTNEKLIRQSNELSTLDEQMVAVFHNVMDLLNRADSKELNQSQHQWLKDRIDCGDDFLCTKEEVANDKPGGRPWRVLVSKSSSSPKGIKLANLRKVN
jgi:uncharacterized protein